MALIWPRPSSYQIGEACTRSGWLAHRYREQNVDTDRGDTADAYVSIALTGGAEPPAHAIEAHALLAWVREKFPKDAKFYVQRMVTLDDPMTGEKITAGKPDLLVVYTVEGKKRLVVVDWKTIGQLYAGYLTQPDLSLQQLIYMLAAGLEFRVDEGQIILVCFDDRRVKPIEGAVHPEADWWPFLERIKAVPKFDPDGPEPMATKGEHCGRCWQRMHCSAYLLPAMQTPEALVPFTGEGRELSPATALDALEWLEGAGEALSRAGKLRDLVKENLAAYVRLNGPIRRGDQQWGLVPTNGNRRGPTVKELEELGLTNLIKQGEPGVKFDWRKAPEAVPTGAESPAITPAKTSRKRALKVTDGEGKVLQLPVVGGEPAK